MGSWTHVGISGGIQNALEDAFDVAATYGVLGRLAGHAGNDTFDAL